MLCGLLPCGMAIDSLARTVPYTSKHVSSSRTAPEPQTPAGCCWGIGAYKPWGQAVC